MGPFPWKSEHEARRRRNDSEADLNADLSRAKGRRDDGFVPNSFPITNEEASPVGEGGWRNFLLVSSPRIRERGYGAEAPALTPMGVAFSKTAF